MVGWPTYSGIKHFFPFGDSEQNMCIVTISFAQRGQLFSESQTDTLFPEMKGHRLNYPEAYSRKESLFESQPSICSTLEPAWTLVQGRENTGVLAITEAHGAFCTWHNQDQVHPKVKQQWTNEFYTLHTAVSV